MRNIIEGINAFIVDERKKLNIHNNSQLILRKIKNNTTIKAYKEYVYILYFINPNPIPVLIVKAVDRVIGDQDKHLLKQLDINFTKELTRFISSSEFSKIIKGTYGISNE
jgi:hypothetical protein